VNEPHPLARPVGACLTCPPPLGARSWRRASDNYRTCDQCLDRLREMLHDIADRYARLDIRPGSTGEMGSRGAPGFGSRAPASEHIIAMRDARSSAEAHVWVGKDGRVHREDERPPLSVYSVLETEVYDIAELRGMDPPRLHPVSRSVYPHTRLEWRDGSLRPEPRLMPIPILVSWLDNQLDWLTRQEWIADFADRLRDLQGQLRPVTGDRRRQIGRCPNTVERGEESEECGSPLYAPTDNSKDDTIRCRACGQDWPRTEWLRLGELLEAS
jgi:hypothetical protein